MPKNDLNVTLKGIDELLFSTEEQRQEEKREQVQQIPIDELHPFTNHPFKVVDDEAMTRTVESIAQFGVLAPLIARPQWSEGRVALPFLTAISISWPTPVWSSFANGSLSKILAS